MARVGEAVLDLVCFPMQVFELPQSAVFGVVRVLLALFWTLDVPVLVRFHVAAARMEQQSGWTGALAYLRSWFPFDCVTVTLDWVLIIIDQSGGAQHYGLLQVSRLLRLAKLPRLLGSFEEQCHQT